MEDDNLLNKSNDKFIVPELQDSPTTFSKKIIIKLGIQQALMPSTIITY